MGLDSMGTEIFDIHGYFHKLTVGQKTLRFLGVTTKGRLERGIFFYQKERRVTTKRRKKGLCKVREKGWISYTVSKLFSSLYFLMFFHIHILNIFSMFHLLFS